MTEHEARRLLYLSDVATPAQIKQAYLDLVKVWHPDRFQADPRLRPKTERALQELNDAYAVLQGRRDPTPSQPPTTTTRVDRPPPAATTPRGQFWIILSSAAVIGASLGVAIMFAVVFWQAPAVPAGGTPPGRPAARIAPTESRSARAESVSPRPASGTELLPAPNTGRGSLLVHNGGGRDAVIVLAHGSVGHRALYVRAGEQVQLLNVAPGSYRVLLAAGRTWSGDRFAADTAYQELERPAEFRERTDGQTVDYTRLTISITPIMADMRGFRPISPFRIAAE
jgi:hypothetical protein